MAEYRTERLGHLIREKISSLILEGRIKDPRVTPFLSITRVQVARDLSYADVYVSNISAAANIERGAEGLQSAAGFIQSRLGAVMHIRKIPRLRFHADAGIRDGFDMIQTIGGLTGAGSPEGGEADGGRAIRIALLGKPNTGKSTLSNRLTSSSASLVSCEPGTTRDVIEGEFRYKERRFCTLDTAGLRRASRIDDSIEYYASRRAQDALENADIVFLLIDAVEGFSEQDKKIAALAAERGRGLIFALNKWDLMPPVKNTFNAVQDRIRFLFPRMAYAPLLPISAATGEGVEKLLDTASLLFAQLNRRIETSAFNAFLERWQTEYPPPSGPATRFKIKYGLQTGENPLIFKVFVSRPQAWTESYHSYICNRLRRDAGFSIAPVRLEIAPSREGRQVRGRRKRAKSER